MAKFVKFSLVLALAPLLSNCMETTPSSTEPATPVAPVAAPASSSTQKIDGPGFFSERRVHGYRFSDAQIASVPIGATRDKVQLLLGSPSTTGTTGNNTYYYISQVREQTAFFPTKVVDQTLLAVSFDGKGRVNKVANYGIQDGKIFDFVSRTTPTGGDEMTFVKQIFKNLIGNGSNN